ncbi:MAG: hypothetical protein SGJ02_11385 [bacterium]|nr:hypothetical protein [bacterium]
MKVCKLFLLTLIFIFSPSVWANPVSFKDGWGIMPTYTPDYSDLEINYSLTNKYSIGASAFYRKGSDSKASFGIAQYNYLLKRWNELESQANIYATIGMGGRHDSILDDSIAGYLRLEGDFETRRIYTALNVETLQSPGNVDFNRIRYRAGVAPYLAPFNDLHTWIIAQVEYMPEMDDQLTVTPLLRFFYNNYALEVGATLEGEPFLAAMAHF